MLRYNYITTQLLLQNFIDPHLERLWGAPYSQATDLPEFRAPGRAQCSDSRWRCRRFSSASKTSAQRFATEKRIERSPPSTMGKILVACGVEVCTAFHTRRLDSLHSTRNVLDFGSAARLTASHVDGVSQP
jgi:hypothetical protein